MAAKDMALFTDISWWNGAVDFAKMKAAGAQGVIIRAGSINNVTGIPYTDVQFERNADLAPQFFDNVAFYWFMRLNHNINLQADYFCNLVANKAFDWLEPDIEMEGDVAGLFQFTARIEENLPGVYQVIYTNPNTWLFLLTGDQSPAIKYDLHEAHWGVDTPQPLEPWQSAGHAAVIHQFSSEGNGMGQTYGAKQTLPQCIALAAYTATPLFLAGLMLLYPLLWLNLLLGLPALAYTVYLLYTGVPVMMGISRERGFLFASAVLAVGLVMLVGVLAATVILWGAGIGPVFAS